MSNKDKNQLQKPKAFANNNQDRKGAKTAPIDNNFVSINFIFPLLFLILFRTLK